MDVGLLIRLVLGIVVGTLAALMVALLIGLSSNSVDATIVIRTVLSVVIILLVTRILVRRAYDGPALDRTVVAAALLSYAVAPAAWVGRALGAQLVLDPSPATYVLDLVVWVAAVVLAGRSVSPRPAPTPHRPYQVG